MLRLAVHEREGNSVCNEVYPKATRFAFLRNRKMLADAPPSTLLARAPLPIVLADAPPSALLAPAPSPIVLALPRLPPPCSLPSPAAPPLVTVWRRTLAATLSSPLICFCPAAV